MIIWILSGAVGLGVLVLGITGVLILLAGVRKKDPDCDYIIVLGAKAEEGGTRNTLNERIRRAYEYLSDHPKTIAILSGARGEATAMFDALTTFGIRDHRLILEEQATSTWQNMKFSLGIIEEKSGTEPGSIGILSSEFHLFRAKMYVRKRALALIPAKTQNFPRWLRAYVREIAGVWHYIILGGTYD